MTRLLSEVQKSQRSGSGLPKDEEGEEEGKRGDDVT